MRACAWRGGRAGDADKQDHKQTPHPPFPITSAQRRALHGGLVPVDPVTPDIHQACSKRAFDGQVRKWRRMLHAWDPVEEGDDPSGPAAPAVGLTSPGAGKRGASARTPATAGRRQVGRIGGAEEEGEGKGGAVPAQPAFGEVADVAP